MEFWIFVLVVFVLWLIVNSIKGIVKRIAENRRYHEILRGSKDKVRDVDLGKYEIRLAEFEELYEFYKKQKIVLKDKKGNIINICPKCGGYMKIVRWRGDPFLGCSNYPNCRSYKKYDKIFELEV